MKFIETKLQGAFIIEIEPIQDERGFFARTWCENEFKKHGLNHKLVQCNWSYNIKRGTIRGMHYQTKPYEETKIVKCTRGAIYDVIVDLRETSVTYKQWIAVNLTENNFKMLYIPEGFAHGFQTLEDHTEVFYQMSEFYNPNSYKRVRYDDSEFNIKWPIQDIIISDMDNFIK